jgi:hypothetical protein
VIVSMGGLFAMGLSIMAAPRRHDGCRAGGDARRSDAVPRTAGLPGRVDRPVCDCRWDAAVSPGSRLTVTWPHRPVGCGGADSCSGTARWPLPGRLPCWSCLPFLSSGSGSRCSTQATHSHGVVLGQVDVEAKTNEIPMFATLLDRIDPCRRGHHRGRHARSTRTCRLPAGAQRALRLDCQAESAAPAQPTQNTALA